jgi:hypothetical protein
MTLFAVEKRFYGVLAKEEVHPFLVNIAFRTTPALVMMEGVLDIDWGTA